MEHELASSETIADEGAEGECAGHKTGRFKCTGFGRLSAVAYKAPIDSNGAAVLPADWDDR